MMAVIFPDSSRSMSSRPWETRSIASAWCDVERSSLRVVFGGGRDGVGLAWFFAASDGSTCAHGPVGPGPGQLWNEPSHANLCRPTSMFILRADSGVVIDGR